MGETTKGETTEGETTLGEPLRVGNKEFKP